MCKVFVDGALKSRNSQRVEFLALDKMMMCYFSCALTELISRHIALEVPLEQLHYQQSFGPTPTAVAADVNRCEDPHKSRSQTIPLNVSLSMGLALMLPVCWPSVAYWHDPIDVDQFPSPAATV